MNKDFHYYAAYCAAYLAGYDHTESLDIAYSDQFTDICTRTYLKSVKGPGAAATTQLQTELLDAPTDPVGLQDITRIWASFHFLPYDLTAKPKGHSSRRYLHKYRLICKPNGSLVKDTVELARGKTLQAAGLAMHVLSDTWAHSYFAGTPSLVINNTNHHFFEIMQDGTRRQIAFKHSPTAPDDLEKSIYMNSLYQSAENNIMNLGHGRAGHLPDYSFARYAYLPAWGDYNELIKDNPSDYYHAFCQMITALASLREEGGEFETGVYDTVRVAGYEDRIKGIINTRKADLCDEWKAFGEELSGVQIEDFNPDKYKQEYMTAEDKKDTFLGMFFIAAMAQKSMVTERIHKSHNPLAGYSVKYRKFGFKGIRDYRNLVEYKIGRSKD